MNMTKTIMIGHKFEEILESLKKFIEQGKIRYWSI